MITREQIEQVQSAHSAVVDEHGDLIAAICTLALQAVDMQPRPTEEAPTAYSFPLASSGLTVKVGEDGVWLIFKSKSKSASIHVRNKLGEPPERMGCINAWCDEIEAAAAELRPLPKVAP
jgi:hypothetical protein